MSLLCLACPGPDPSTDYDAELARIDRDIAGIDHPAGPAVAPIEADPASRRAYLLFARASLTGDFGQFKTAEVAIEDALRRGGPADDLYLLKATLDVKLHRLERARNDLASIDPSAGGAGLLALRADVDLQEGRYEDAKRGYEAAIQEHRTWDNLARLAFLNSRTGDPARAETLYLEAEEEITAKEMRSYAWVELQRGQMDLDQGRSDRALARYRRAGSAYSGYWLIEEHTADALERLGRTAEAIDLYRRIIARTRNPAIVGALATLAERKDPASAEALRKEAERLYEAQYQLYPEAALGHFVEFLIGRKAPSRELLEMAETNCRLRPNGDSKLLLAKAYLKMNDTSRARAVIEEILGTPWRTPEIGRLLKEIRDDDLPSR